MNPFYIACRSIARKLKLTQLLGRLFAQRTYEDKFAQQLEGSVRIGDTVWDVGANVGFYTEKLAAWVGQNGSVVAIEPSPACAGRVGSLIEKRQLGNVRLFNVALGRSNGFAKLLLGEGETSVANRIASSEVDEREHAIQVPIYTGDHLRKKFDLRIPNVIKIDVEGHEVQCIEGLAETLASRELRTLLVEVHFGILEARGERFAPVLLEKTLKSAGFSRVSWIDSSHLGAYR